LYLSTYSSSTSSWSGFTQTLENVTRPYRGVALSDDGSRGVVCSLDGYIYYFTWTGTTYSTLTQILDNTSRTYNGICLSYDGLMLVVVDFNGGIYFSTWNGTNYSVLTKTLETVNRVYMGVAISRDKLRIAYGIDTSPGYVYWADWNGTNFNSSTQTLETNQRIARKCAFSPDKKILWTTFVNDPNHTLYYAYWNGTNYGSFIGINTSIMPANKNAWGLWINTTGTNLYLLAYGLATYYKLTIPVYYDNDYALRYTLDTDSVSGTTVKDSVSNSYNATLVNGATIAVDSGSRVSGQGYLKLVATSSQYLQLSSFTSESNGMSFSCWFRSNATANQGRIFDFGNGPDNNNIFMRIVSGNLDVVVNNGSTQVAYNNVISSVNDNVWRHIVWTLTNNSVWTFYINGTLFSTQTNLSYPPAVTRTLNYIGK
jgi:hypothetical protein